MKRVEDNTFFSFLPGNSEMAQLFRSKDWSHTPPGPAPGWPQSLKAALGLIINSPFPMAIVWGPDLALFYNDPFVPVISNKQHQQQCIGQLAPSALPDLWPLISAGVFSILDDGKTLLREDYFEWTITGAPILTEAHQAGGVLLSASPSVDSDARLREMKRLQQQAQASEATLRNIISAAPAGIALFVGRDLVIQYPNQTFIDIVGKGPGVEGMPLRDAMPELLSEGQPFLKILDDVYTSGKMFQSPGSQVKIVQNGVMTYNYYNITYTPIFNRDGEVYAILDIAIDVTDQIKAQQALEAMQSGLEAQVQYRTEELAASNEELTSTNDELLDTNDLLTRSNEELAQYAYVASHDLQEPLRKIRFYSDAIINSTGLSEENEKMIRKISDSAARMSMLIKDLLNFSRLIKSDALLQPVDLMAVLESVRNDFELGIEEKKATLTSDKLPKIVAVHLQMNQLFYNMISNALKFVSPDRPPEIHISCTEVPAKRLSQHIRSPLPFSKYFEIVIADNGIGFESTYAEQIFEVFRRLHPRDIYPGSGIGLALCRRIVSNLNGVMFAESEPDKGTAFHILIPQQQREDDWI